MFEIITINKEEWQSPQEYLNSGRAENVSLYCIRCEKQLSGYFNNLLDVYLAEEETTEKVFEEMQLHIIALIERLDLSKSAVWNEISDWLVECTWILEDEIHDSEPYLRDQMMSFAELISSYLYYRFLKKNDIDVHWKDNRDYIKADNNFGGASIADHRSRPNIIALIQEILEGKIVVMQDHLASTKDNDSAFLKGDNLHSIITRSLGEIQG